MRYAGVRVYLDAADGWSMMVWLAGVIVALGGWRVLLWSLPSVLLLWFAIPMPFQVEHAFRQPLQRLATQISCATLVALGQPAIAEANTIRIGDTQFGVAEACSGLRIFVGIAALAFVYVVLARRSWWTKSLLLLAVFWLAGLAHRLAEFPRRVAAYRASRDLMGSLRALRVAVSWAKNHKPAVILMDLALRRKGGFDYINDLQNDPATKKIPIIIITGRDLTQKEILDLQVKGVKNLRKGRVEVQEIKDEIRKSLSQSAAHAE